MLNRLFLIIRLIIILILINSLIMAQTAFKVNSTGDGGDNNINDGVCGDGTGDCTFRAAIEQANYSWGVDTILFDIPGMGPHTIQPNYALPNITDPLVIDGTSEPDFTGTPVIELDGSNAGEADGIWVTSGNSTIRGLVINRFNGTGIVTDPLGNNFIQGNFIGTNISGTDTLGNMNGVSISGTNNILGGEEAGLRNIISGNKVGLVAIGGSGNEVLGNYIGTDVTGTIALGVGEGGTGLKINGNNNIIGGTTQGAGNVISGIGGESIFLEGSDASGNLIQGNFIGTDATGTVALGGGGIMIVSGASGNIIGGTTPGARNVISGNDGHGVSIDFSEGPDPTGNIIQGNFIGTDVSGTIALGNGDNGIQIMYASNNTIGGTDSTATNTIAYNHGDGVFIVLGVNNAILSNSFFLNLDLGIDLYPNGPTQNDSLDTDEGSNNLQNHPDILSAKVDILGEMVIEYHVESYYGWADYPLTVQFFKADPEGSAQGRTLLYTDLFTISDYLVTSKTTQFQLEQGIAIYVNYFIVATATDSSGNTSEFSPQVAVINPKTTVYPGDTDNNRIVEALDVLPIGVYFKQIGPLRTSEGINWSPINAEYWSTPAATYADANGDGIVDEKDVIAIGINWGNTHGSTSAKYTIDLEDTTLLRKHKDAFQAIYHSLSGEGDATKSMKTLLKSILSIQVPTIFSLYQNYPNPFNTMTTIQFSIPETQPVTITVYNLLGQEVTMLANNKIYYAGIHKLTMDAGGLSSGIYFYRLDSGKYDALRKLVVIK